jgi:hypothetical protein
MPAIGTAISIAFSRPPGGGSLLPETLAFQNRVEADGGVVNDIDYVNSAFILIASLGLSHFGSWASPRFATKGVSSYSKIYCLFGNDQIADSSGPNPFPQTPAKVFGCRLRRI